MVNVRGGPLNVKQYETKWNLLMGELEVKKNFIDRIISELLLFVGELYNFYKYQPR